MSHPTFGDDVADTHGNSSAYLQIATPKSPNSDGAFSPAHVEETGLEQEIKQKLCDEVDIEILLKHREYNLIKNEMERVESQIALMENIHGDPQYAKYIDSIIKLKKQTKLEVQGSVTPGTPLDDSTGSQNPFYNLRKTSHHEPYQQRTSYGGLRPMVDAQGNKICIHKRSDGVIVRIDCPDCGRTDFGSAQGFLNHARLAHAVEYKSQEDAALRCGSCVRDEEQDEVGVSSIRKLKELGMDPDKQLCPGVCIVDESKKRRRSSMKESTVTSSQVVQTGHLEKLLKKEASTDGFKELVEEVTTREEIEEDTQSDQPDEEEKKETFKKSHNRRKSRGGLSAVKFDDNVETFKEVSPGDTTSIIPQSMMLNGQEMTMVDGKLTPAQRRRIPTATEPARTRSRSSRENSR